MGDPCTWLTMDRLYRVGGMKNLEIGTLMGVNYGIVLFNTLIAMPR